jgi:hypothetical protein
MNSFAAVAAHVAARFKEPSSWAALAGVAALVGVNVPAAEWQLIANAGAGIMALVAFFLPENSTAPAAK